MRLSQLKEELGRRCGMIVAAQRAAWLHVVYGGQVSRGALESTVLIELSPQDACQANGQGKDRWQEQASR